MSPEWAVYPHQKQFTNALWYLAPGNRDGEKKGGKEERTPPSPRGGLKAVMQR